MGFALKHSDLPFYTYGDYLHWEGRWELVWGVPYAMSPAPKFKHQDFNSAIICELRKKLANCKSCKAVIYVDWKIDENTVVQPDALVICQKVKNPNYIDFAPELIFEILSPSSAYKDRHIKYELYESQKVKYYAIVDPDKETVEIFHLVKNKYQLVHKSHSKAFEFSLSPCRFKFDFSFIW